MKISINERTEYGTSVAVQNRMPEVTAYAGAIIALGAIGIGFLENWSELTKNQKTATFSLIAIGLFVTGLIASDTAESRRRLSSFLYIIAGATSAIAVYVTFADEPAPLQAFALATVVTLLGYTVSPTIPGQIGLYLASAGTLVSLGFQSVESENLRLYTQISLVSAFAVGWLILAATRTVHQAVGYALGVLTIIGASQYALFREFDALSYSIALGGSLLFGWLYFIMRSSVLATAALLMLGVGLTEWVIRAMDSSTASLIGMFVVGALVALIGASAIGDEKL